MSYKMKNYKLSEFYQYCKQRKYVGLTCGDCPRYEDCKSAFGDNHPFDWVDTHAKCDLTLLEIKHLCKNRPFTYRYCDICPVKYCAYMCGGKIPADDWEFDEDEIEKFIKEKGKNNRERTE